MNLDQLRDYLPPVWVWWIVTALAAVTVLAFAAWHLRRGARALFRAIRRNSFEDNLTIVAAAIATLVAGQGMWQFVERTIHVHWSLRALGFAFLEVAVVTSAVRARRNMRENFSAGIDGVAVWAITGLSAVLAAMEARSLPEAVFRLAAPLVAAWLWERGMAIERHRIRGTKGINWRLTPERVLVWLGLAEATDRTAGDVDRARRIARVSLAVVKVDDVQDAPDRKKRKAIKAFRKAIAGAVEHAQLATDEAAQKAVLAQIDTLRSTDALVNRRRTAEWADPVTPEKQAAAEAAMAQLRQLDSAEEVTHDVTTAVTARATNGAIPAVEGARALSPIVPPAVTPPVTVERVMNGVTFDVTDADVYDLDYVLSGRPFMTSVVTPIPADSGVTNGVTEDADEATKAKVMRAFWDSEIKQKRFPKPVELARHADADPAHASRLRAKWVEELSGWDKRRAKNALRDKASA